jgi:uncharacterized protein YbdZ (MbtH family)
MSGKQSDGSFDLTPTKAAFYLRRSLDPVPPGWDPVGYFLKAAGLQYVKTRWGGWNVKATQGQIWTALSGQTSAPGHYG